MAGTLSDGEIWPNPAGWASANGPERPVCGMTAGGGQAAANAQPFSIFKSTNAGATWTAADSGLPSAGVWDVVAQPGSDTNAFVTTQGPTGVSAAVYATTDGGSTWNPVGPAATAIAALAIASDHTIVAATGGVYDNSPAQALHTSTSDGASWTARTARPV